MKKKIVYEHTYDEAKDIAAWNQENRGVVCKNPINIPKWFKK